MSVSSYTSHYFLLTPSRLSRVQSASRAIFGHLSGASPYQPNSPTRRSPRPYLHKKLNAGKLANLNWPHIQPQLLEGRTWYRQEEADERRESRFEADRDKEDDALAQAEGKVEKKEKVVLKKGKRAKKQAE